MSVAAYARELKTALDAKDPRHLGRGHVRGSVLLVFPWEQAFGAPERITIRIEDEVVRVVEGAEVMEGLPTALIRCRLADWLRFAAAPTPEHLAHLQVFGDLMLFDALGRLFDQKRSAISARFFK